LITDLLRSGGLIDSSGHRAAHEEAVPASGSSRFAAPRWFFMSKLKGREVLIVEDETLSHSTRTARPRPSIEIAMPALSVFVFQCEDTDLHALTLYRSGDNLPSHASSECWRYRGRLRMTLQSLVTLPLDAAAAITQLRTDGLSLARFSSGIILFPQ
jgi:hypothetical protein